MMRSVLSLSAPLLMALLIPSAWAVPVDVPLSVETGRDVGDGQVLYPAPYDPKAVADVQFVAPTVEYPYYEIVLPLGEWTEGTNATVSKVLVNGTDSDSFYVFVDGFSHVQSGWITHESATAPNVVLVTRSVWHNGEATAIDAEITTTGADGATKTVTKHFDVKAPDAGGAPAGWKRYQSLVLHEQAGLARVNEPVEFSITVRAEDCANLARELRLFAYAPVGGSPEPLSVQTFNAREFKGTPPGTSNKNYLQHPSKSVEAVFFASVPANEARLFLIFYDNPEAPEPEIPKTDLSVEGPSLGATVDNQYFRVQLDPKSGQIAAIDLKGREDRPVPCLTNSYSRAVHWNPDSFSDNGQWGHTFAWNPPDRTVVTARGPLMFRVTNSGRMPEYTPQVHASVTYTFYAGVPYVECTTVTEVRDPLNASAIRNGEIVLDSHLIDHFVWKEKSGQRRMARTLHGPNWQDEWATRVDHDVPWIAMTNEAEGYGVGEAITSSIAFNAVRGEATDHRPAFYLYYHHFWNLPLTYFTRGWVYPFSDYQRGPILQVDAGSTYVDKMAFMPFYLAEEGDRYGAIDTVSVQVLNPLVQRWGR
ncbi:MAG: hypothetical protein IT364_07695 [Candidatus Hydrogenedentes bacterium]|nr:hypothetical protein [Candidatus Hydrogenedentota bacterium]